MAVPSPTPSPSPHTAEKARLRKAARKARMHFVSGMEPDTRHALEEQLAELLAATAAGAKIIATYSPIGTEISPEPLIKRARRLGKTIAYPAFDEGAEIFRFRAGPPVMPGPHCIKQPGPDAPVVVPDLVLVPLVACGDSGVRLGQGKGHYDRVLAELREKGATLVGIGWKVQRLAEPIPTDEWDVSMDVFACPRGVEYFTHD